MIDGPRRDGGEVLPVFDAIEEIEPGLPARGVPPRRRGLGPARGAGIAAAALVLLVAGIALGGLPRGNDPSRSDGPTPTAGASQDPGPITLAGPCHPGAPHAGLRLAPVGVPYAVEALAAAAFPADQQPAAGVSWMVPSASNALYLPNPQYLVLAADPGACLHRLVVTYAPTVSIPENTSATLLYDGTFDPPLQGLGLGQIPIGDWVLWMEAQYQTGESGVADLVTVSFFRVIAGQGPTVTDTPAITPVPTLAPSPATPCGTGVPSTTTVVEMDGRRDPPLAGAVDVTPTIPSNPDELPTVFVPIGSSALIDVVGGLCAVSWEIRLLDYFGGRSSVVDRVANPSDDPARASQNEWAIAVDTEEYVVATLHFAGGPTITRTWHVVPLAFNTPSGFLVAADGTRFAAEPGCGLSLQLANGYTASDGCGSIGYSPGDDALKVGQSERVVFEIPGWTIVAWGVQCGIAAGDGGFTDDLGCDLGGGQSDDGGPLSDPVSFLAPKGDLVLRIGISAVAPNGDRFSVTYYAREIAR